MTDIDYVTARIVAQRLCNLLLQFPSAAVQGVQWHLLEEKYKEVYGTTLDVKRGHNDPLAAATALLWDVLRLPGQVWITLLPTILVYEHMRCSTLEFTWQRRECQVSSRP